MTASLTQSFAGVAGKKLFTWSSAPLAADRAELEPRALMTAAPRFWHCGTKTVSSHLRSGMNSVAGFPLILAFVKSGYWVLLWFPQMVTWTTSSLATPAFLARALRARL